MQKKPTVSMNSFERSQDESEEAEEHAVARDKISRLNELVKSGRMEYPQRELSF